MANKTNAFSFRFNNKDLQEQVSNYASLKITKSARGQVILFFGILNLLTLGATFFINIADIGFYSALVESLVFYAPILFFVYKGHRWALIALILLWTGDKGYGFYYQLTHGGSVFSTIIFLLLGVGLCMRALQVENAKKNHLQKIDSE